MAHSATPRFPFLLCLAIFMTASCGGPGGDSSDDPMAMKLKGRIVAPAVVVGATVEFYGLVGDERRPLGATPANPSGAFETEVSGLLAGQPLLICAAGQGKTKDSWTGKPMSMPEGQPLCAVFVVNDALADDLLILDPWSTLAFSLAEGYRTHGSKHGVSSGAWSIVIPKATGRLAAHLSVETPPDIGFTDPVDPALETLWIPSARMASGLSAAALARMASGWPVEAGQPPLTMPELLQALIADARDGLFDGLTPDQNGEISEVKLGTGNLTANTLRLDLAAAIHDIVTQTETTFAEDVDAVAAFNAAGGWYQQISMAQSALFPAAAPTLFDPIPPAIELGGEFPAKDALVGSADLLSFKIKATDPHGVDELWLDLPAAYDELKGSPVADGTEFALNLDFDPTAETGPVFFRILARDDAGNQTTVDRTFRVSLDSPTIHEVLPPSGECLPVAPEELLVHATHPDDLEVTVTLNTELGEVNCAAISDGHYQCPIDLEDGAEVIVLATDPLGRADEAIWTLCVDTLDPTATFDPPDDSWYGPGNASVHVTLNDEHKVTILALTVDGEDAEPDLKHMELTIDLPLAPESEEVDVELTLEDVAGHQATASATYKFDGAPPDILTPELGIVTNSFDYVVHKFRVLDPASGIASVKIISGEGIWSLNTDGVWYELVGTVVPLPGFPPSVTVEAEDMVGNKGAKVFVIFLDSSVPVIKQSPTFVTDDALENPVYDADNGTVTYAPDGAPTVSLNSATCVEKCPPFAKFAPLLFGDSVALGLEQAVPSFAFTISDPCPTGAIKSTLTVEAAWHADETLLHEVAPLQADCLGDTVTIPLLLPLTDAGIGKFPNDMVPDRLHIAVTDLGGQVATHDVLIDIQVLPPPLFLLDDAEEGPEDPIDLFLAPVKPALHDALKGGAYFRRRLVNPTVVPATLTVESLPLESLLIAHARVYVQADEAVGTSCPMGNCRILGGPGNGECEEPLSYAIDTWYADADQQVRLRHVPTEGYPAFLLPGNSIVLGANEWSYLDVVTGAVEAAIALDKPVTVALENGAGHKVHLVTPEVWGAACTWSAGLPPDVAHYDLPDIVTSYALKIEAAAAIGFVVAAEGLDETASWEAPVTSLTKTYAPLFPLPLDAW